MNAEASPEVEADRYLLAFKTYENYLNHILTPIDYYYLRSIRLTQQVAQLGYRYAGETLTKNAFEKRIAGAQELLHPCRPQDRISGDLSKIKDPVLMALSLRERQNRIGKLHTIIFIRVLTRLGSEISGYIDYAHRLRSGQWTPIFQGRKILKPNITDLGYYNWRTGYSQCNHSDNYKVLSSRPLSIVMSHINSKKHFLSNNPTHSFLRQYSFNTVHTIILDPVRGLLFQNVWDHLILSVDPNLVTPGPSTSRTRVSSHRYLSVILYDHRVRRMC
ncbi:cilia- and flagella-associated protein 299-like [Lycorma delicatula]|uniref:cilia- and flagella-associated protein 299-like n=1 Tax=Lycorma delicatula TaxID=130591 RepID=UPI003F518091